MQSPYKKYISPVSEGEIVLFALSPGFEGESGEKILDRNNPKSDICRYEQLVECGFNLVRINRYPWSDMKYSFLAANGIINILYDMSWLVENEEEAVTNRFKSFFFRVDNNDNGSTRIYDNPKGFAIKDEPNFKDFGLEVVHSVDKEVEIGEDANSGYVIDKSTPLLKMYYDTAYENEDAKFNYINLLGIEGFEIDKKKAGSEELAYGIVRHKMFGQNPERIYSKVRFAQYIALFKSKFLPSCISYDSYPIIEHDELLCGKKEGVKQGALDLRFDIFYYNLQVYLMQAQDIERPFWAYCLSLEHTVGNTYFPLAKEEYLRFESFSALAYGAKGLVFWRYHPAVSIDEDMDKGIFLRGLLDQEYQKTPVWYFAQRVMKEVKKYQHIFANSRVLWCRHIGRIPEGAASVIFPCGPLTSINADGDGVLVAHHIKPANNATDYYLVIVNHSPNRYQKVTMTLECEMLLADEEDHGSRQYYVVKELTPLRSGESNTEDNLSGTLSRTLVPGGYIILHYVTVCN